MVRMLIDGVSCRYASSPVLRDITLETNLGDMVGVLGPNGSGKTTLLKTISRLLKPEHGAVFLDDKNIWKLKSSEIAKSVAITDQNVSVHGIADLRVFDYVLLGRHPHIPRFETESSHDLQVAKSVLYQTKCMQLASRKLSELSSGELQRVAIARALAQQPRLILLDEPTSHLDIANQVRIMELVKELCDTKELSAIVVLHDFNMAAQYCTSLLVFKEGRMQFSGSPDEVLTENKIKSVFEIDVAVGRSQSSGKLYVIPASNAGSTSKTAPQKSLNVRQ